MEYDKSLVIDTLKSLADTSMKVGTEEARQRAYAYNTAIELIEKIKVADTPQPVTDSIQIAPQSEEDLQAVIEAFLSSKNMSEEELEKFRSNIRGADVAIVASLMKEPDTCKWEFDQYGFGYNTTYYETGCSEYGNHFDGDIPYSYCPYCGRPIEYV